MLLDELGVLEVLLGEAGGHLGDEEAGDGEAREEGPVALPLPTEEDRPRVERRHRRSDLRFSASSDRLRFELVAGCAAGGEGEEGWLRLRLRRGQGEEDEKT